MRRRQQAQPRKNAQICFVGGQYEGHSGRLNDENPSTKKRTYVIEQPASYAEAAFQQQPKMEKKLKDLCVQLAKCGIGDHKDLGGIASVVKKELRDAIEVQKALGNNTKYEYI
eukprot:650537-Ditylum_brightwellii.AAC.1